MRYKDNENILMKKFCVFKYLLYLCTAFEEKRFSSTKHPWKCG